jgi:hypothetical protein
MTDLAAVAKERLAGATTRGAIKRLGEDVDRDGALRDAVIAEAKAKGAVIPDDIATWSGKRVVKLALDREAGARVIGNPIRLDEAFVCAHCGTDVPPHGRTARDHCPACLRSRHVDVVPGDRAADCGGILDPVSVEIKHGEAILTYKCRLCGAEKRNRALSDGDVPDRADVIVRLSAGNRV